MFNKPCSIHIMLQVEQKIVNLATGVGIDLCRVYPFTGLDYWTQVVFVLLPFMARLDRRNMDESNKIHHKT